MVDLLRRALSRPEILVHEEAWERRFAAAGAARARGHDWHSMVWLCITPRSGSTWLARLMLQTRALGRPWEHLATDAPLFDTLPASDWAGYLDQVGRGSAFANGVASVKGNLFQLAPLIARGLFRDPARTDRYVYLTREDLVAQAISLDRALQTGRWTAAGGRGNPTGAAAATAPAPPPTPPPAHDPERISRQVEWLVRMMADWERVFAALDIQPLRLTYEGLERDPRAAVAAVAAHAGVEVDVAGLDLGSDADRQRTPADERWAQRFHARPAAAIARARAGGRPVGRSGLAGYRQVAVKRVRDARGAIRGR